MRALGVSTKICCTLILIFCFLIEPIQATAACPCRGDVCDTTLIGPPDGTVDIGDIFMLVLYMRSYGDPNIGWQFDASLLPCSDVADISSIGVVGGDGLVSIGDLNFYLDVMLSAYHPDGDSNFIWDVGCLPDSFPGHSVTEILIWVNDVPWDGFSQVSAGDTIWVGWFENDPNYWWGGFANFNLNVSRGEYNGNFYSQHEWELFNFTAGPDGQGGIDIGGACSSVFGNYYDPTVIFLFSFQIPFEKEPAYTIHIRPTQGSWRRVLFDELPTVDLPVGEDLCGPDVVIYVDETATGDSNGTTWANAYKHLQDAFANSCTKSGSQIWVAEGTYRPDANSNDPNGSGDRDAAFELINCVAVYGGFPSGGGSWGQRDPKAYRTILSGDLDGNDVQVDDPYYLLSEQTRRENSYHIVSANNVDSNTILDGFIITAGNANADSVPDNVGGGMLNISGNPKVTNCVFVDNSAGLGGCIYNYSGNSMISKCSFVSNSAEYGGAINNDSNSSPDIVNCIFTDNQSHGDGGGIYNDQNSNPVMMNCTLSGNRTLGNGGGVYNNSSSPNSINCTFSGNDANDSGGGIYNLAGSPYFSNCIIWSNSDSGGKDESAQIHTASGVPVAVYSCIQDGNSNDGYIPFNGDSNNIDDDPKFMLPTSDGGDGWGDDPCTSGIDESANDCFGNLHLCCDSPCIDAGDNSAVPPDKADLDGDSNTIEQTPLDLDGNERFKDTIHVVDTGNGTPPVVDMGAYESPVDGKIPGDFNRDGIENLFDYAYFGLAWLSDFGGENWNQDCDISIPPDDTINPLDWDIFEDYWLAQCNPLCIDN
ncbi:MAG: hypothetical protein ACYTBP_01330 [Planctomycetota bacterium]